MAFAGNLLWFVFGGGILAFFCWVLTGLFLSITVIGLPLGVAAFRVSLFAAFPFGKELIDAELVGEKKITGTGLANFIWVILAGLWLAIGHILSGLFLCLTIIGIPFGLAHIKLAGASFAPLGKRAVSVDLAKIARNKYAAARLKSLHQNSHVKQKRIPDVIQKPPPLPVYEGTNTNNPNNEDELAIMGMEICPFCMEETSMLNSTCEVCARQKR